MHNITLIYLYEFTGEISGEGMKKTLFYLYEFTDDISGVCMKKHCFTCTNSQIFQVYA